MNKILIFYLFITIICGDKAFSQSTQIKVASPVVMPVTPEAASMAKHVSYPVNYSTGLMDIKIPLYEIKVGDITLPITLSYNTSGLKPREASGRIATGWTLNAEPSIMRYVKGVADEEPGGYLNTVFNVTNRDNDYLRQLYKGVHDEEPDEFHYQTASGGGTCYIGGTDKTHLIPYPINEDRIDVNGLGVIRIYDKNGINYEFGSGTNCKEYTDGITSCWLCNNIYSSCTGAQIAFDYIESVKMKNNYDLNDYVVVEDKSGITMTDSRNGVNNKYTVNDYGDNFFDGSDNTFGPYNQYLSAIINGRNIKHINFDNGSVVFGWNGNTVKTMVIKDKEGNLIRYINFYITNYNSETELTKLDSVLIGAPGCENQVYRFEYNDINHVPPMSTNSIDHWGFNNSFSLNSDKSSVPITQVSSVTAENSTNTVTHTIGGIDRNSNGYYAMKGILTKLTNPYGIETTFSYEGNQTRYTTYDPEPGAICFGDYYYVIVPVGGLRIIGVNEYDPKTQTKRFKNIAYHHIDNMDSPVISPSDSCVGVVRKLVSGDDYCHTQTMCHVISCESDFRYTRLRTWGSMPLSTIRYVDGSIILYNYVIETNYSNDAASPVLVTKYYYQTPSLPLDKDGYEKRDTNIPFEPPAYENFREASLLRKVEQYRNDTIVSTKEYQYDVMYASSSSQRIAFAKPYQTQVYKNEDYCITEYDLYRNYVWSFSANWMALQKEKQTLYFKSGAKVENAKDYFYATPYNYKPLYHKNPVKIVTTNSNGLTLENHFRYCTDTLETYKEDLSGTLFYSNMLSMPIEQKQIIGTDTSYTRVSYSSTLPLLVKTKIKQGAAFNERLYYDRYDAYGNIGDISTNANVHTCYLWSYNNQYPIAKIENIAYDDLLTALGKNSTWVTDLGNKIKPSTDDSILVNSLRTKLTNALVTTYTYKPLLGVSSITDSKNVTTYFDNDYYGRLTKSYLNNNGSIECFQKNEYNLGIKGSGLVGTIDGENIYAPLVSVDIEGLFGTLGSYKTNVQIPFNATVEGGSGQFTYYWKLTIYDNVINRNQLEVINSTTSQNPVYFNMKYNSCFCILECKVHDNILGTEMSVSKTLYAAP